MTAYREAGREAVTHSTLARGLLIHLTRLVRKGEKFDADKVARVIDGRKEVAGHGGSDMPKWGDAFKRSGEGYSEKAMKARIDAIAAYIETLQVK